MEWEIIAKLYEKLNNPDLTTIEYTKASSSLAHQISNINKLLKLLKENKETNESEEQTLGEYVINVSPKTHRRWDLKIWKKRLSYRR